jgi:hypothetical protein
MGQSPRIGAFGRTASLPGLLCVASYPVWGQTPGVTANEIFFGSCSALEGPSPERRQREWWSSKCCRLTI